jgi:hypothetical protein
MGQEIKKPRKRIKRIHINKHRIASNAKHDKYEPVITCKVGKDNLYGHEVSILDDEGNEIVKIVYSDVNCEIKQLGCGARVYIETKQPIRVDEYLGRNTSAKEVGDIIR